MTRNGEKSREIVLQQFGSLMAAQPLLTLRDEDGIGIPTIGGDLVLHTYNVIEVYNYMYPIQIYPNKMFDLFAPIVRTKRDVISADYEHIYYDGELCLEVPTKVAIEWRKNPNLLTFVNQFVLPWFYSYEYYMRHKQYPFGVREHGLDGWFQLYFDLFEVSSSEQVIALLRGVISAPYFCHEKCPCGSGKTYSECHKPQIMGMKNSSNYSLYKQDYERFTRRT